MKLTLILIALLSCAFINSSASEVENGDIEKPDEYYKQIPIERCTELGGHYEANRCLSVWMARLDKELDELYKAWLTSFTEGYKGLLNKPQISALKKKAQKSQSAWVAYRKTYCDFRYNSIVGTGAGAEYGTCYIRLTRQRISELKGE